MVRFLTTFLLCVFLAACARNPDEATMRESMEAALQTSFGKDTFKVVNFARRGSAVDSTAPRGESRRVAYYDVELELTRDLVLGDWDDPGAATLVSLLGAGPRSIQGIKAGGNKAGDRIVAHASAIYREEGDKWAFVTPAGFKETGRPRAETGRPPRPSQEALDRLSAIARNVEAGGSRTAQGLVADELQRSVARITGRLARNEKNYPIAAGQPGGEYAAFANALTELAKRQDIRIVPLVTGGGEDNLGLLRDGSAVAGLAQADTARAAYEGKAPFASVGASRSLRSLGSLYPEYVHIIVRGDSTLGSVANLKGARVAMGPEGSAVRSTLATVLAAHGLEAGRDYEPVALRFTEALSALGRGEVDAVAHVIGLPATPLRDVLAGDAGSMKLLPIDASVASKLAADDAGLLPATIAAGVYPEQREPVATMAVPALLLATDALSDDDAAKLVRVVFENSNDLLAHGSAQGSQISVHTARKGLTVPLHPGAERALTELEDKASAAAR